MAISNEELMAKAREAKSAEELLALAKENNIELTEEEANAYFEQMNTTGELSDDELDSVAGGGCHKKDGRLVVTVEHYCKEWKCPTCGAGMILVGFEAFERATHQCMRDGSKRRVVCKNCKHMTYEKGLWLCNNPDNLKFR